MYSHGESPIFSVTSKKTLPIPRSLRFTTIFSCKSLIVFSPTSRSVIHFELTIVDGMRKRSTFTLLHVDIQFCHQVLKRQFFWPLICLSMLVKNQLTINVRTHFWSLNSTPSLCLSCASPKLSFQCSFSWYCRSAVTLVEEASLDRKELFARAVAEGMPLRNGVL